MDIVFLLVAIGLAFAVGIGWAFLRAVDTGQFDDLDEAGQAVLEPADVATRERP